MPLQTMILIDGVPLRSSLDLTDSNSLLELKGQRKFGVYLISQQSVKELLKFEQLVCDRGTKPENKSLAQLLLNQKRLPLLRCNYSSAGRLKQGVTTFQQQVAQDSERNIYFIAVPERLFVDLWAESAAPLDANSKKSRVRKTKAPDDSNFNLVLNLLPPVSIPRELEQTYVGQSLESHLVRVLIMRAASSNEPVLILGETGTGKEVTARSIHRFGNRSQEKFVPVNCGSIPSELLEAELFGIKGGVATNVSDRRGLWEQTGRGTLFLDEIGELSLAHQVKILRALNESAVRRVGEVNERKVHARIIAATNRQLFSMVSQGTFRADLYYRLRVLSIPTPSIRDVPEDFQLLAQYFWKRITGDEGCLLTKDVIDELQTYTWPGNVRELKGILKNLLALFGAEKIRRPHVRAVFDLVGVQAVPPVTTEENVAFQHRMECLRHLRTVDEVVRACQVKMSSIADKTSPQHQAQMGNLLSELDVLLRRPLLFHSEVVFSVTRRLRDLLLRADEQVAKEGGIASTLEEELSREFELLLKLIFSEVSELSAV